MSETRGSLEKIILAGIGAMAVTAEKSREMLDELVKKGEITVEQGKKLNEELKHNIKTTFSEEVRKPAMTSIIQNLDKLNAEEIAQIKAKLQEMETTAGPENEAADSQP